jgi:uncharacterized protein (UPF0548 family)
MKLFLREPATEKISNQIRKFQTDDVSYRKIGSTKSWRRDSFARLPNAKIVDGDLLQFRSVEIGNGQNDFQNAVAALRRGVCFDLSWVNCHQQRNFHQGDTFCLTAPAFGIWTANFCRVVYVQEDEDVDRKMLSVGIGTLACHAAAGEERLSVVWERKTDEVDFLIGSFSQPRSWLSKLFVSYLRKQQRRFAQSASQRMREEVGKLGRRVSISTSPEVCRS